MAEDKKLSERLLGGVPDTDWFKVDTDSFVGMCKEIADLEQQNADLQRRLDKWNRGHNSLHARNADEKIADLEKRLAEAENKTIHDPMGIRADVFRLQRENADLRARLQDAETALQGAMAGLAERDELKRRLQQAESNV